MSHGLWLAQACKRCKGSGYENETRESKVFLVTLIMFFAALAMSMTWAPMMETFNEKVRQLTFMGIADCPCYCLRL